MNLSMLTGLKLPISVGSFFLNSGVTLAVFKHCDIQLNLCGNTDPLSITLLSVLTGGLGSMAL